MSFDDNKTDCASIFECKLCGDCCIGYGGTYVTHDDIKKISRFIGIGEKRFVAEFCALSGEKPVLAQKKDGYCIFWDKTCRIHPVKPKMCRDWPFIRALLKYPDNWRIMAGTCPGMNPDADENMIIKCVKQNMSDLSKKEKTDQ